MRCLVRLALLGALAGAACQSPQSGLAVIVDKARAIHVHAESRVPRGLLELAGISLSPGDQVMNRGMDVDADAPIPPEVSIYLQVRKPVAIQFDGQVASTTAPTVGEFLAAERHDLSVSDLIDPPAEKPLAPGLVILYTSSRSVVLTADGQQEVFRTAAALVGSSLAEAGLPIIGSDACSSPAEAALPPDGQLRISRISDEILLSQEPIDYEIRSEESPELDLGIEQVLEPGQTGLAITRTRIRYEDGSEVLRKVEPRAIIRQAQDRIVARGTRIREITTTLDGVTITYWRTLQMYATVYSPCNSGTGDGSCSSGTASGLPAGKGVVAVDPGLYAVLGGQRLYIPGYGFAVVGDVGGGYLIEQNLGISRYRWIDLGFDDNNIQDLTGWVTVYFLAPAPTSIPEVLK